MNNKDLEFSETSVESNLTKRQSAGIWIVLTVLFCASVYYASFLPDADWRNKFYPLIRDCFRGVSPYWNPAFQYPPWVVLPLFPFVIFPINISRGLLFVSSILFVGFFAYKTKNKFLTILAVLISSTVVGSIIAGNIDALLILAMFLPPAWMLFFLMIKPQIGVGVALYFLYDVWKSKNLLKGIQIFAPVVAGYIITIIIFPDFLTRIINTTSVFSIWNRSIFPYGVPIGIFLLWFSIYRKNVFYALAAGPFLSPYTTFFSYLMVQVGLLNQDVENFIRRDVLQVILAIFFWIIMLVYNLG